MDNRRQWNTQNVEMKKGSNGDHSVQMNSSTVGVINVKLHDKLKNSIICYSREERKWDDIASEMREKGLEGFALASLSKNIFVILFEDQEIITKWEAEGWEIMKEWFIIVEKWRSNKIDFIRCAWIECRGIPMNAWTRTHLLTLQKTEEICSTWTMSPHL